MNAPRHIIVDQTHIRGHVTGIERVALDLFSPEALAPHEVRTARAFGLPRMILAQQLGLPLRGLLDRQGLYVFPGFPPGPLALTMGRRCLIYVHDTFLLTRPEDLHRRARLYMAPSFALALRLGSRFLVNSHTTGTAVRAVCRRDAMVALLRPAVRDVFDLATLPGPAAYVEGAPLRLLAIGTIEPRKDYPAAIALTAELVAAGIPAELHLVGRCGWGRHDFLDAPPPFLRLHGYVDDHGLRELAGTCHLLLSTSKAEGLGLPLLEIQHGGIPVAAPEGEVFSEVLGGSGLFLQPEDAKSSAAAILNWAREGGLARAAGAARANVARWNGLAAGDAARFKRFLAEGPTAYQGVPDALIPPLADAAAT